MNILYTNFHIDYGGGHDTYIKNLAITAQANVYVACPASGNLYIELKQADSKVYPYLKGLYPVAFPSKLKEFKKLYESISIIKKIIKDKQIDIVHTNGSADNRLLLYVKWFSKLKFKIVFTKHNSYPVNGVISRWRLVHFNDAIIFVSKSIYQILGFKVQSNKITVIHNGIDINRYIHLDKNKQDSLFTFVSNAGTAHHKGWHYLFHAIKLLPLEHQNKIRVIMVGTIPPASIISWLIKDLPSCTIEWTDFSKTPEDYLIQGDIGFVLSNGCDTISFACREMMACGLPVIVSNFGGLPENIDDGINGWITPVGDILAIKQLLQSILAMPGEQLQQMSFNARQKAIQSFGMDQMIDRTIQIYRELL